MVLGVAARTVHKVGFAYLKDPGKVPSLCAEKAGGLPFGFTTEASIALRARAGELRAAILHRRVREGAAVELPWIKSFIFTEWGIDINRNSLNKILHGLGFQFGRTHPNVIRHELPYVVEKRNAYLAVPHLLPSDATTLRVEVYLDESYINRLHKIGFTWFHKDEAIRGGTGAPSGKGKRFCFLTGLTEKFGVLPGTLLLFQAQKSSGDYHENIDSEKFMAWVKGQMVPALRRLRKPGQDLHVRFILDNAPYHLAFSPDEPNPAAMTRPQLHAFLRDKGVEFREQPAPKGHNVKELRDLCEKYYVDNPEERRVTLLHALFDSQSCGYQTKDDAWNETWEVLLTPPYHPELQPIEMLWSNVKQRCARQYSNGRTMAQLEAQLRAAFVEYGTADNCASLIAKVRKIEERYKEALVAKPPTVADDHDVEDEMDVASDAGSDAASVEDLDV